jgi:hypothetical protein
MKFGMLTVRSVIKTLTNKNVVVICDCACGGVKRVNFGELTKGNCTHCGCKKIKPSRECTKEVKESLVEMDVEPGYLLKPIRKKRKLTPAEVGKQEACLYLYGLGFVNR